MNRTSTIVGIVIGALVGGYVLLFAVANKTVVVVDLVFAETHMPMYGMVAISVLGGAALVGVFWGVSSLRRRAERKRLTRRLAEVEDEVGRLRNAPITGDGTRPAPQTAPTETA